VFGDFFRVDGADVGGFEPCKSAEARYYIEEADVVI
jgi:hypothetical protein